MHHRSKGASSSALLILMTIIMQFVLFYYGNGERNLLLPVKWNMRPDKNLQNEMKT